MRLGVFVLIGTILFIVGVYLIGQRQDMFKSTFTISSFFKNVNGLQKGNNVRYSGINIGTVKNIEMLNDSTIRVDMNIDEKIIQHIKKDAIATIGSDGLVGNMIVNVIPGRGVSEKIENGDIIESYSKIGTSDILNTLNTSSENAAILTADLLDITQSITEGKGTIGVLLNDTVMAKDLKQSVNNIKNISQNAVNTLGELNEVITSLKYTEESALWVLLKDSISGKQLKTVASNLETSSSEIDSILKEMDRLVKDINSSEGAYHYMIRDTSVVNTLRITLENIKDGTDKFNQNMEALKHNFLTRGYFRKLERQEKRAAKKAEEN